MTSHEINCTLRVLAKLCYSKVSTNPDLLQERDNMAWTRIYDCYQELDPTAPTQMTKGDFLLKFANISYKEAANIVSKFSRQNKDIVIDCILFSLRFNAQLGIGGGMLEKSEVADAVKLAQQIIKEAQLENNDWKNAIMITSYAQQYYN